jgi:hypothetical protein
LQTFATHSREASISAERHEAGPFADGRLEPCGTYLPGVINDIALVKGHRSHAMDVLKANALDFARRIDEIRDVLAETAKNGRSS